MIGEGKEWCNYLCDTYDKTVSSLPRTTICKDLTFKGPGYVNYSKVGLTGSFGNVTLVMTQ